MDLHNLPRQPKHSLYLSKLKLEMRTRRNLRLLPNKLRSNLQLDNQLHRPKPHNLLNRQPLRHRLQ